MRRKVLIIGLDCVPSELIFEEFREELSNLKMMLSKGVYGRLKSCIPAITIPAWMVMATGKSAGELGLYGFRHRKDNSYRDIWIANSQKIKIPTVWDILSKVGKSVCLLGVPPTYPPKPLRGNLVSCFITPDSQREFTYPPVLKEEIEKLVGDYMFDVIFRSDEKDKILKELYEMTQKRFKVLKYLIKEKEWDLFFFVEIGTDRVHHAFWKFYDEKHHLHIPNNKYKNVIRGYYKYIDEKIGEILDLDKDMVVMVVSDHGAKRMKGCFCINEWLIREGYLCLKKRPKDIISLERAQVDWSRTKAWGWGGYYARIFFNLEGREEEGIVKPQEYEALREELISKLKRIKTPEGRTMKNKIFKPEEIYPKVRGDPPDLMVYFDELSFRSAGTLGHGTLYLKENDTGPDDAVHSEHGIFIFYDPRKDVGRRIEDLDILDIAPTILNLFGLSIPKCMKGKILRF